MDISNVAELYDNGEFITVITHTGSVIHLPNGKHSIVIKPMSLEIDDNTSRCDAISIDFHQAEDN